MSNAYPEIIGIGSTVYDTLMVVDRYPTEDTKLEDLETKVLSAQQQTLELEAGLFDGIRSQVAQELGRIQATAAAVARLDVLCSFAAVALANHYTRPIVDLSDEISITDGRHPVVEEIRSVRISKSHLKSPSSSERQGYAS